MDLPKLFIASNNSHKVQEIRDLIGRNWDVKQASDLDPNLDWEENGNSFAANAQIKAEALRKLTPACVLADDSGLEVTALSGRPGIRSSRYAGENATDRENNKRLLDEMKNHADRSAQFVCCLCFIDNQGKNHFFQGVVKGQILTAQRGTGGFGYDPLFYLATRHCTMAELSPAQKAEISHRGQALQAFNSFVGNISIAANKETFQNKS